MTTVDNVLLGESAVDRVLVNGLECGGSPPEIVEWTKLASALEKCAPEGGELLSGLAAADEARGALIAARKDEIRNGGNPSLRVESASTMADAAHHLAIALATIQRSIEAADAKQCVFDTVEVKWRAPTLVDSKKRVAVKTATTGLSAKKTPHQKQKRLVGVLSFDTQMALATCGFSCLLAAKRRLEEPDRQGLKEAVNWLKKGAGAFGGVEKAAADVEFILEPGPAPYEVSTQVASAFAESCLAWADRLAVKASIDNEVDGNTTSSSNPRLPARLLAGAADRETRAADLFFQVQQHKALDPTLAASSRARSVLLRALADGFNARAKRSEDRVGDAVSLCKAAVAGITPLVAKAKDKKAPEFSTPPPLIQIAMDLATALGRRLDAYDSDNRKIYFEAVPDPPDRDCAALTLAKPLALPTPDLYPLADLVDDTTEPPPPSYDQVSSPENNDAAAETPALSDYDAVRVTLPVGYAPGQRLVVAGPDGARLETVVPAGCQPGDTVEVRRSGLAVAPDRAPAPVFQTSQQVVEQTPPTYDSLPNDFHASLSFDNPPAPAPAYYQQPPSYNQPAAEPSSPFLSCPRCTFNNKPSATECEMCASKL